MRILALVASGVRNLVPLQLEPRERFNVFAGDNGQGKTNLLEAIYVIATLRSFRTTRLADLVSFATQEAKLGARVLKDELTRVYEVDIAAGSRRVRLDGKAVRPLAKYFGGFNVVVFTPEDLGIPRGSPGDRRRFLDRGVFTLQPDYLGTAQDYERVLKNRNSVLRQVGDGQLDRKRAEDMLAVYDVQLAQLAVAVIAARQSFLATVRDELARAFASITRSGLAVDARYQVRSEVTTVDEIVAKLAASRHKDYATNATQTGPHRDDVIFELDGREAGTFASQGQLRAIMLAWKTAELTTLGRAHGDLPILLLDDVSSELDPQRNEFLFAHLATLAGQCFITTTHASHVLLSQHRADYRIHAGEIRQ